MIPCSFQQTVGICCGIIVIEHIYLIVGERSTAKITYLGRRRSWCRYGIELKVSGQWTAELVFYLRRQVTKGFVLQCSVSLFINDDIRKYIILHQNSGLRIGFVVFWLNLVLRFQRSKVRYDATVVKARHQAHISVSILYGHKGGISDMQRLRVVVGDNSSEFLRRRTA